MTSFVFAIPHTGSVRATRDCAHCRATIPAAKPKNARYCRDACRAAAAHARRTSRLAPARPTQFSPASSQQARPHSRHRVIASFLLLVGLLLGGGLAFAYQQLLADDPLVATMEAQLTLRRRPAGEFEKQLQADGNPGDLKIYPQAHHGFMHGRTPGDAEAAKDAAPRVDAFLAKQLK